MDCRICLENIVENELYLQLTCNHTFHYECINKMQNNLCPLCRKDNTEFFLDNGIVIKKEDEYSNNSDDVDEDYRHYHYYNRYDHHYDNYDDDDYYDESDYEQEYKDKIDELVVNKNYNLDFINNIKSLKIFFNDDMLIRAKNLYDKLQQYNLKIRSDSVKCINYIKNNSNDTLDDVCDIMIEMNWFCNHTNYSSVMSSTRNKYSDRFEQSKKAKETIIKDFIINANKYDVKPPNINSINIMIEKINDINNDMEIIRQLGW